MVTRSELFPSRFLNANNVDQDHPIVATIEFAKMETLESKNGNTEEKLLLYFSDCKQVLALNGVNFDTIVEIAGEDDSDRWDGTKIEIYRTMTEMKGKQTPCIRVRAPQTAATPRAKAKASAAKLEEMNDEINF
jgi:hypothetical protein